MSESAQRRVGKGGVSAPGGCISLGLCFYDSFPSPISFPFFSSYIFFFVNSVIFRCSLSFGKTFSLGSVHWVPLVLLFPYYIHWKNIKWNEVCVSIKLSQIPSWIISTDEFLFLLLLWKLRALEAGDPQATKPHCSSEPANHTSLHVPNEPQHPLYDLVGGRRRDSGSSGCKKDMVSSSSAAWQKGCSDMPTWRFLLKKQRILV